MANSRQASLAMFQACPLSAKVPKIKKVADEMKNLEAKHQRDVFCTVIDGMWHYPNARERVKNYMLDVIKQENSTTSHKVDVNRFRSFSTLGSLDEDWRVNFILKHSGITAALLGRARDKDSRSLNYVLGYMTHTSVMLKLPKEMEDKNVAYYALKDRVVTVGNRLGSIRDEHFLVNGTNVINWGVIGAYFFEFDDSGIATKVHHRPTSQSASVDPEYRIDDTFDIDMNWSDLSAVALKGSRKFKIADMFAKNSGPFRMKQASGRAGEKVYRDHVEATAKFIHDARAAATEGHMEVAPEDYKAPQKDKKEATAKRARELLAAREKEVAKHRRLSIKSGAISAPPPPAAAPAAPAPKAAAHAKAAAA